jgi:endothelin-converting enzyme/putative endopeptidase
MAKSVLSVLCFLAFSQSVLANDPPQDLKTPPILDATAMKDGQNGNPAVDPCEDFYQFACGQWLDTTVIPAEKKGVSRQATIPLEMTDVVLNKILEKYAQDDFSAPSSQEKQLGAFYRSCMSYDQNTQASLAFVKKQIKNIQVLSSKSQLPKVIALSQTFGFGPFFGFSSQQDPADSTQFIGNLAQGGISLPEKDYYLATDAESLKILADYKSYITNLFTLFGEKPAKAAAAAETVLKIETALAQVSLSLEDRYDTTKTVHISSISALQASYPGFDWKTFFQTLKVSDVQLARFNIEEPDFFAGLINLLQTESLENLKVYLTWKLIDSSSGKLAGSYEQANFAFWQKRLNGVTQEMPRWKYCTQEVENRLGYALAEAYVKSFDGSEIKKKTEKMISDIKDAFQTDLISLSQGPDAWLDQDTYKGALEKIQLMGQKVGGPEKWRDYSQLEKQGSNFLFNTLYVTKFESHRDYKKIGGPVDRTEWYMMPWEFNAYYDPANNEFNFPFGILQPPSLDLTATEGANLGSFGGGTIGHELTHGFDNSGSQYDAHGNIKNWWTDATQKKFDGKAQCFINQASQYMIKDVGMTVDGSQTLTENLADQGGVKLGYLVLEKSLQQRPEGAMWNGYTERQQYWIGYAQSWCTKSRPESLRVQMTSDPHPPAEFRVNGVLMNRPEFARDFKCASTAKMVPANRCSIW